MGDSAYKAILAGLSVHHDSLEGWLQFWTWWVIVGVACELAFIGWDHISEYREWSEAQTTCTGPFPSRPSRLKLFFELASVALVVFGIVGELRVDAKLGDLDTTIQKTNEDRANHLQQEADSAETAAGRAQCSADKATLDERHLAATLSEATRNEEEQQARLEQEQSKTSELQAKAVTTEATFEAFIGEVTQDLAPLSIDRKIFLSELKVKPPHTLVELWYDPSNFDTYVFASQLHDALGIGSGAEPGAGWNVTLPLPIPSDTHLPPHVSGTSVLRFALNGRQQLTPVFIVPAARISSEPLIAQFEGSWAGGLTILSADPNDAKLEVVPSNPLAELNTALGASLPMPIVLVNQLWPRLGPDRIIVVITARPKIILRQRAVVSPVK